MSKKTFFSVAAVSAAVLWSVVFVAPSQAATWTIDPGTTGVCDATGLACTTIQSAINAASSGDTISVAAGTYQGQVVILKSLTLRGAGSGTTAVKSPASLSGESDGNDKAVMEIVGSGTIAAIENIAVEGEVSNESAIGIHIHGGATATLSSVAVRNIRSGSLSASNFKHGIVVGNSFETTADTGNATIANSIVSGVQNIGIMARGAGAQATVSNNTVTGLGATGDVAQVGIDVSVGARASVTGNTVRDYIYTGSNASASSVGISVWDASNGNVTVSNNTLQNNQAGIIMQSTESVTISSNAITATTVSGLSQPAKGIWINTRNSSASCTDGCGASAVIQNNTMNGSAVGFGLVFGNSVETGGSVYSTAQITATASGNAVSGWNTGVTNNPAVSPNSITLSGNTLSGNTKSVSNSDSAATLNAAQNYWGASAGPGTAISGSVTAAPWYTDSSKSTLSTNTPLATNTSLSASAPEVVIPPSFTQAATIVIPATVVEPKINLASLVQTDGSNKVATVPAPLTFEVTTPIGTGRIAAPANIKITGPAGWDGIIKAPTVKSSATVNIPAGTLLNVIEIGLPTEQLTFDKAVRITFPGQKGKAVGYSKNGSFTEIATICAADSQSAADALPAAGDCKIDVGSDLVVWTKHFTEYVVYAPSVNTNPNAPSGGGTDVTPPTETSVVINETATSTKSKAVTLKLNAVDAFEMKLSNKESFEGVSWEAYATTKQWTLDAAKAGAVTVYAKFRDEVMNESAAVAGTIAVLDDAFAVETATSTVAKDMEEAEVIAALMSDETEAVPSGEVLGTSAVRFTTDIHFGMRSDDVAVLQRILLGKGLYRADVTGYFGPITLEAVKAYQRANGIAATGYVGALTRTAMNGEPVIVTTTPDSAPQTAVVSASVVAVPVSNELLRDRIALLQAQVFSLLVQMLMQAR